MKSDASLGLSYAWITCIRGRLFFVYDGVKNLAVTSTLLQHMEWTVLYFKYSNV